MCLLQKHISLFHLKTQQVLNAFIQIVAQLPDVYMHAILVWFVFEHSFCLFNFFAALSHI